MKRIVAICAVWLCASPLFAQNTPSSYSPNPAPQFLTDAGAVCGGCLLYTYVAGSTTQLLTYTDSALTVANADPIVLDAAGRATIFLQNRVYRFDLKTAAGSLIWTRDNLSSTAQLVTAAIDLKTVDGRITLQSGTCVPTSDQTAKTTVFFTPCGGNRIALYDGTNWNLRTFTELSVSLGADAASLPYDLFIYDNAGTPTLERLAWTNDTTRATNLTTQDGVYVKSGAVTRRYLGTYRTTTTIGQTEDSAAKRLVWNYYNRVVRPLVVRDATATWTYTTAAYRQANGAAANQVAVVVGVNEVAVNVTAYHSASNSGAAPGVIISTAIGLDGVASLVTPQAIVPTNAYVNEYGPTTATIRYYQGAGYHFYVWMEYSAATGTTTWNGTNAGLPFQTSGLMGSIEG